MTTTAAPKPAKLPREEDPRNPVHRLTALLDEGTLELITADDDSGMLAAVGRVDGTQVVAFCSDATVMALHDRVSPPTINLDDKDPEVDLDIPTSRRDLPDGDLVALNNSFGFGGANVAVAFGSTSGSSK